MRMGLADKLRAAKPQRADLGSFAYTPGGIFDLILASVFINILALAMPLTLLQVYDRIIPNSAEGTLIMLIIGVGTALLLEACLRQGRSYVSGWMGARFEHLAGVAAVERLLNVSIIDYERQGSGVHLERFNSLGTLKEFYAGQAILALCDLPFAVLFLGAMYYLAGHLVVIPIVLIIVFALMALYVGTKLKTALESRMMADDRRYSFIIEVLGGVHTVKGLAMEEQMIRRYERLQETCATADYNVALHSASASSTGALFSQLVLFCVVGYGATFVIDGVLTVGGLAACTMLAGRSMQPLQKAVGIWTRFQSIQLALDRVRQLFELEEEKPAGLPDLPPVRGELRLEGLTFSYGKNKDGEEMPPMFDDVDLTIASGETVGITGSGSSGKTTLLYLMMGVLPTTVGRVTIDGLDLMDYDPSSIRRQIAYLPQEGVLFNGTILENVTMFRDEKIDDALDVSRLLGLDSVVAHMPHGYDTMVGDGAGDKLPKGIKQRIAIARALVDKPRVLLFDEANAAMDSAGDSTLRNLLERLKGRVTLVLVTPRPSMLNLADRIFDIGDAKLIERDLSFNDAEPRRLIDAVLDIGGSMLRVLATHLGLKRRERAYQFEIIRSIAMADPSMPVVLLGDMNEWLPAPRLARRLLGASAQGTSPVMRTFLAKLPIFPLDRMIARPGALLESAHAVTRERQLSDHLPLMAQLNMDALHAMSQDAV